MKKRKLKKTRQKSTSGGYQALEPRQLLATFVVNSAGDDMSGSEDGMLTLREAIVAAETNAAFGDAAAGDSDGDVIRFDSSLAGETITLANGEFSISDDLAIFGGTGGVTIDAAGMSRIFSIDSAEQVVLRDLMLTNGMTDSEGGAVLIAGTGMTTFNGVDISSSVASGTGGGAIASSDQSVAILNSMIQGNQADGASGSGGGLLVTSGSVFVGNSTMSSNVANRAGGAIEIIDGSLVLRDSMLGGESMADGNVAGPSGTAAPGNGGGIHVTGMDDTRVALINTDVRSNVAASEGGGLWNQSGSMMTFRDGVISNNVAAGDDADNGGGGVFNNGGNTVVRNSTIRGNLATGASGSGGGFLSTDGVLSIVGSDVAANTANRAGGGFEIIDGRLYVGDSTVRLNVAGPDGSAAPGNGGALHVTGTAGTESAFIDSTISSNVAAREGGGLWNQSGSQLFVRNSMINGNIATGDAADDGGGGVFNNGGTTLLRNSVVTGNIANGTSGSGGGIFSTAGLLSVRDSEITANVANRAGGGIEVVDGSVVLIDTMLGGEMEADGNVAGPAGSASPGNGGGLHVSGMSDTRTTIVGGLVGNNVAASEGGGLWNQSGSQLTVMGDARIVNNVALGDAADNGGGGIFNNGGRLAVMDAWIENNLASGASGSGGGIFSTDGTVTVENSQISSNVANRAGGGVELIDGTFLMFDSVLGGLGEGNVAGPEGSATPGNGGGLHVTGTNNTYTLIDNSLVLDNDAGNEGGGLWNQSGSRMVVRNGSLIRGNTAGDNGGGGILNKGGSLAVNNSLVTNNQTTGAGGGISAIAGSDTQVSGSSLFGNMADSGGGFYNLGTATVMQSSVTFNEADSDGGGILTLEDGLTTVVDSTVFGNTPNDQV